MSDALAAMQQHRPWRTLYLAGKSWRHNRLLLEAFEMAAKRDVRQTVTLKGPYVQPEEETEPWSLWRVEPDRMRAEFKVGTETVTAVWRGETWWSSSPSRGYRTNGGRPNYGHGIGPGERLLDPAQILPLVDLAMVEKTALLGRPAYRLVAHPHPPKWPRSGFPIELHMLGTGADEYELVADANGGLLLRTEARLGGLAFQVVEVEELALDLAIPGQTFEPVNDAEYGDVAEDG